MKAVVRRWSKEVGPSCRWTRVFDAIASRKTQNLLWNAKSFVFALSEDPSDPGSFLSWGLIWHEPLSGIGSYLAFERFLRRRRTRVCRRRKPQMLFASLVDFILGGPPPTQKVFASAEDAINLGLCNAKSFCVNTKAFCVDAKVTLFASSEDQSADPINHLLRNAIASRTRVHRPQGPLENSK